MTLKEIFSSIVGIRTLNETDLFIAEMANFLADVTDLPGNILLWTKPQPAALPHDKYRMKIYKDRIHVATISISKHPQLHWQINRNKLKLDAYELDEASKVISNYSSLFIQYVDDTLTSDEVKQEIKKLKGYR
jgi:hypothetical protein